MLRFNHRSFLGARLVLILALLAGLLGVVPVSPVYAATLIVPDNYPTIQAAINAATPGDTIMVRAGTYFENLTLNKSVILTAASFDSNDPTGNSTIIDGGSPSPIPTILIPGGISPMPTVRGFVIRNGVDNIKVISEAIIEHNYFIGSTDQLDFSAGGGGVVRRNVFFDSQDDAIDLDNMTRSLLIEHNRLMYNRDDGIEVRLQDATAPAQPITITVRNNEIIGCDEDGIQFIDYGQAVDTNRNFTITSNVIANCRFAGIGLMGNAISVEDYSGADIIETIRVYNNTIYGNDYGISGGDNLVAINNIIANSTTKGVWRVQGPAGASSIVDYSLFYNNGTDADQSTPGSGNKFGQDPLFAWAPNPGPDGVWRTVDDDFSGLALQSGSPAIDAGYDPNCPATDLNGVTRPQGAHCDLGAFEGTSAMPTPTSTWYIAGNPSPVVFGTSGDLPVAADYNGDGSADIAVFHPSNGSWYIAGSAGSVVFGASGDLPVIADYNGDGKADIAVFRPSTSNWHLYGVGDFPFGTVDDIPVVGDYNGDGMADIAVFRPSTSTWYIAGIGSFLFGEAGDIPVVADYNGDGMADIAVFRPSTSTWYIAGIGDFVYGMAGDIPVVADYNGDGMADIAVFRPSTSTWHIYGLGDFVYGMAGDIPVVADYNADGWADIAVFRP